MKKYTGKLAEPFEPIQFSLLDETLHERAFERRFEERLEKFVLLLRHHGIEPDAPNAFNRLLWALIFAHVPGFQVAKQKRRGRPVSWSPPEKARLVVTAEIERRSGCRTEAEAMKALVDNGTISPDRRRPDSSLRRLQEAKQDTMARAMIELMRGLDGTDALAMLLEILPDKGE